ncbi:DUF4907 domain-containing protein [Proteiniphilum sp. X52]|uniref:DUF4907 domain-containing protein n=1 Tax=Proteiniphilum sp. X52 TaxID=2382159 RepID=UPI001313FAA1|nr:DUF4907 domain-containing protein [Proteiniphilum sp. X52]
MTKRILVLIFLFVISIILLTYFLFTLSGENKNTDTYSVRTFKSGNGWGYQINTKEKVIIVQPYMPCITGDQPFPDEKSARVIGELVLSKIRNNEDPSITREELNDKISM